MATNAKKVKQPPPTAVMVVANHDIAQHLVVTIPESKEDSVTPDQPLASRINCEVICGPNVTEIWKMLELPEERPENDDTEPTDNQAESLRQELVVAEQEAAATAKCSWPMLLPCLL
jgi:hypothetical protein